MTIRSIRIFVVVIAFSAFFYSLTLKAQQQKSRQKTDHGGDVLQWVNPFIGTAGHGHTYPGATVPFGMVQLSPDNGTQWWDWCGGYHHSDSVIVGFSHTHLSGTGIGDLCDIALMPTTKVFDILQSYATRYSAPWRATFTHAHEEARPGYYAVQFSDQPLRAEVSATATAGIHRYSFGNESTMRAVVIDLGFAINWDRTTDAMLTNVSRTRIIGKRSSTGWAKRQTVWFALDCSVPFDSLTATGDSLTRQHTLGSIRTQVQGRHTRAVLVFPKTIREVTIKVAISYADSNGAIKGVESLKSMNFDAVRKNAEATWRKELSKVRITTLNDADKTVFYTALYHTMLAPIQYSDLNGRYKTPKKDVDSIGTARGYTRYDVFSLWDTFRAEQSLFTILHPHRVSDMVQSLMAHYREYGLLPVWSLVGNETNTMTGYHAVPVLAEAYFKRKFLQGMEKIAPDTLLNAMLSSARQDEFGIRWLKQYGYIPHDKFGFSVTRTLEYSFDDWCIAEVASSLKNTSVEKEFRLRAMNYKNVFDPISGFMRAKLSNGTWKKPFDPYYSILDFDFEYTEGNAWQHSWFVPHDIYGLIGLHGGKTLFTQKLDSLFSASTVRHKDTPDDVSGLIGQYAHGNEPSHHIAYLYNYAGAPHKTQAMIRNILRTQYNDTPHGLCGNEDCGQMSAWAVFSMLGLYPVNPVSLEYAIGTPLVKNAEVTLPAGKKLTITAQNLSESHKYIQSATLNGKPLATPIIRYEEIMVGGQLVFVMSETPTPL